MAGNVTDRFCGKVTNHFHLSELIAFIGAWTHARACPGARPAKEKQA